MYIFYGLFYFVVIVVLYTELTKALKQGSTNLTNTLLIYELIMLNTLNKYGRKLDIFFLRSLSFSM